MSTQHLVGGRAADLRDSYHRAQHQRSELAVGRRDRSSTSTCEDTRCERVELICSVTTSEDQAMSCTCVAQRSHVSRHERLESRHSSSRVLSGLAMARTKNSLPHLAAPVR